MASGQPLKGVNLGGWLVLEPWMTPSLFKGTNAVDEYGFCQQADQNQKKALTSFRDTFITEQDFVWLSGHGIEAVRLPVGYWLFGVAPYEKTYRYVDIAFDWADKHDLKILLDLHGAPGSQNGEMHSGQSGIISWTEQTHIDETISLLQKIAKRYGQRKSLLGISFLNEPSKHIPQAVLHDFYVQAQATVTQLCHDGTWFVFSDAFKPRKWRGKLPNMYVDHHHYQIYTLLDKKLPGILQLLRTRWWLPFKIASWRRPGKVIIGEWSLTLGRNRYRPQRYARLQTRAFASCAAWFYWNYKTESGGMWSFRDCIERGLISPEDLNNRG